MTSPADPASVVDPLIGQNVGGYIVEGLLGAGGVGLVYRARHTILNRHFAVKVLRPEIAADASVSSNFLREAQTLSSLKHPHIIDIVGFGELVSSQQYMVMEFLEGKTLEDELEEMGRMSTDRALGLGGQILDALNAAHSVGIIHRDLKPSNVILARVSGGTELVKLLDFGLAKQQPQVLAANGKVEQGASIAAGTPEYIAPEQALGKPASVSSDLYSFGVMLFEMLTGRLPFDGGDHDDERRVHRLLLMHVNQEAPTISSATEAFAFPYELETLVADLLQKDPAGRPSSAQTVQGRLEKVKRGLQQQATQQRPNPLLEAPRPKAPTALMFEPLPELGVERRSRLRWGAPGVLLLLAAAFWISRPSGEDALPVAAAVAAPAELPVVAELPAVAEPLPAQEQDLLDSLSKRAAPVAGAAHRPAPAATVIIGAGPQQAPVEITKSGCEPNERWRQAARDHLQELQQSAASSDDARAWTQFEAAEPLLSAAIGRASTGVDCDAVDRDIQQLAGRLTHAGVRQ